MSVETVEEPRAAPGHVVLRADAAGVCGSELEGYMGRMGNRTPPLVMGHEFAGTVTEAGDGVDPGLVGRVVAVNPLATCGECRLCRMGHTSVCPQRTMVGIHHPGAFAELVQAPAGNVYPLPEGTDARIGALAEPLANGVHAARLGLKGGPAEHATVIGAGTIGIMCLQAALLSGVPHVSVIEPHEGRRDAARSFGAAGTFASAEEAESGLRETTEGFGPDLVLDAAGAEATRRMAAELVRPAGTAVLIGLHDDASTLDFHHVVRSQVNLQGSYAYTADDYEQALEWLVVGEAGIGELPPPLPLESGPEVFADLVRGPSSRIKVFLSGAGA